MTIQQWLSDTYAQFKNAGIETTRLDSLVLLSDELGHDKSWILGHPEYKLQGSGIETLNTKIAQRLQHTPLAYIRGKVDFYGREFVINEHVLVPRPESESIIELLKALPNTQKISTAIDIGTGSGVLAITAKLELPALRVIAIDIEKPCLQLAQQNARQLSVEIELLQGNLLMPLHDISINRQTVLICNLPYVPTGHPVNQAATHEPHIALYGGVDGLRLYKKLCMQLELLSSMPEYIITESLVSQHAELTRLFSCNGYKMRVTDGLAQCFEHTK
jgi:release factor glutamine methyltransferase